MDKSAIIKQIEGVLARVLALIGKSPGADPLYMGDTPSAEAVSLMTSAIERLAPPNSSYHKNAQLAQGTSHFQSAVPPLMGVLRALHAAYQQDYLQSIQELIHADMFADFLEMSEHLLEQKYKDPAAVLCGSVLEEHLRKLSVKHGISPLKADGSPKKADTLNSELAAVSAYSSLDQKGVTTWLGLRNKAAHGHYSEYTNEQVSLMLQSVRDFISRLPV
jgi:hypothetical protein